MASNGMQFRASAPVRLMAAMLATSVVLACSTTGSHQAREIPALAGKSTPTLSPDDLELVTDGMREFVRQQVPRDTGSHQRAWTLAHAVTNRHFLPFRYDPSLTLPPGETYRRSTGNCLSFSLMLVAMARQAGVAAHFQEAILEPEYSSVNDTFVNSRHINVVLGEGHFRYTVDVSGRVPEDFVHTRRLSDREAYAQYYNNLGVDALLDDDLPAAWVRFSQALELAPDVAYLWSNLGVTLNRNGQTLDAERAYQTALAVDRGESIALNNLFVIYQQEGRDADAAELERRVERHRKRNPYYLAKLATDALESQQYDQAIDLLRRSIRINEQEYRFHGALAQAQYLAGNSKEARVSLDLARSLAPPGVAAEMESLPLRSVPD